MSQTFFIYIVADSGFLVYVSVCIDFLMYSLFIYFALYFFWCLVRCVLCLYFCID